MGKKKLSIFVLVVVAMALMALFVRKPQAIEFDLFGNPVKLMGYAQQTISYGIPNDNYFDTKRGFQSALFQGLLEVEYALHPDLKFFGSGKVNADWAYPILSDNNEWNDKGFNHSRHRLYIFDDGRDLLNECHISWTPGDFYFRVGKQVVVWGETDGFRLMDQINPVDQRRGLSDLQFENTILPLWLVRAEYRPPLKLSWLQDLGFQIIFNPNVEFRPNERIIPGNELFGIWAPNAEIPLGGPFPPFDYAHVGSFDEHLNKPNHAFDDKGMEFGFRVRSAIWDSIITLNYFYGKDNDAVRRALPRPPRMEVSPFDGRLIIHPAMEGYYPRFQYVGATFTRDLEWVKASFLGGVSPVLRLETLYAFDSTFMSQINTYEQSDEFRWAIGADWKVKIPFLNAKAYFMISPQFYHRRIMDYPSNFKLQDFSGNIKKDNYQATLMINTTYFHNKLQPMFFWLRDISNKGDVFKLQVSWEQSHRWKYTLGALLINAKDKGVNFQPLEHKDQIFFTISYKF